MNYYEKLLECVRINNGYITVKETEVNNINRSFLTTLVRDNKLERVGPGIYKLPEYPADYFYILSKSSKKMCFSHESALYLHNLSDKVPIIYDVTVLYNYSGKLLNNKTVSLRYVRDDIFNLGMIEIETINGFKVKCYDLERTMCDIIRDRNKMDGEVYIKALKNYSINKNKNIVNLIKYARKLGVEKEVVDIMEVLL